MSVCGGGRRAVRSSIVAAARSRSAGASSVRSFASTSSKPVEVAGSANPNVRDEFKNLRVRLSHVADQSSLSVY